MKKLAYAAGAAAGTAAIAGRLTWNAYRYMMCRDTDRLVSGLLNIADHEQAYFDARDQKENEMAARPCIHLTATSPRGDTLAGYYYCCGEKPCGRIVFMVHGFRTSYLRNAGMYYDFFTSRGFDLFCCDNVAHGRSGGRYMGYDTFESQDCLHWIEALKHCFGEDIRIVMHGQSLGGATVCKMSDKVPENVKFIIDDCGFTSAVETIGRKMGKLLPVADKLTQLKANYRLEDTDVRENVRNARVPMLFVHGTEDKTVPFAMGPELYELCGSEKDCLFVEHARHVESIWMDPTNYGRKVDAFIAKYMDK